MTVHLWRAMVGRFALAALAAATLTALMVGDQMAQPDQVRTSRTFYMRFEQVPQ